MARTNHRINTPRLAVLAALPATQAEICAKTGVSQAAVSRWVAYLRECADAHIGGWKLSTNQGPAQAIYQRGAGADVHCSQGVPKLRRKAIAQVPQLQAAMAGWFRSAQV
jgi:hypothetical protein